MKFNNRICILVVLTVLMLLCSISLVSASDAGTDVQGITNNNDLSASGISDADNMVQSDLDIKSNKNLEKTSTNGISDNLLESSGNSENVIAVSTEDSEDNSIKSSSNEGNGRLGEDGIDEDQVDFHDVNGLTLITTGNLNVSDDTYSIVFDWVEDGYYNDYAPEGYYENPWVMNDTTWVYCIESGPSGPDGYYYGYPGIYKRITLTDEQLINPVTGEDVLPYLRTFIYNHFNDTENFTVLSNGKVAFPNVLWSFTDGNYTNPNSHYNRQPYNNPSWKYVNETMNIVKSGNGIPNSGKFYDTDLTYQFYLYYSINDGHLQNILGFNLFTKVNVIKEWDDEDNKINKRPESITIDLYSDGELIAEGIVLDEGNNWNYTFTDLPVYSISNLTAPLNEEDYEIKTVLEDDFDLTITKIFDGDTPNPPNTIYVNIYADDTYIGRVALYKSRGYTTTLKNFNKYDENGHEINYEIRDPTYSGSLNVVKSEEYQVKIITVSLINEDLKGENKSIELYADEIIYGGAILEESNGWSYTFLNLDLTDSNNQEIDYKVRERFDSKGVVHIANYTIKESDVPYYNSSMYNYSSDVNLLYSDKARFFDGKADNILTGVKIINKLEFVNLTVSKVWDDKDNLYGKRPANVTVNVYENGEIVDSIVLNKDNGWKYELKNLPKYKDGELINYSIDEVNVTYYHYKIKDHGNNTFTVTNTLNKVHIFKYSWKLIGKNISVFVKDGEKERARYPLNKTVPANKDPASKVPANKAPNGNGKLSDNGKGFGKYQSKPYIHNNKGTSSLNKKVEKYSYGHYETKQKYYLFIYLYEQYLFGNMTYNDFIVLLKENGIQIDKSNNWDSEGTLEFEYDDIKEVPDSMELSDSQNHFEESGDDIEKNKPADDSGVIDSGEVEVEEVYVEE